MAEVGYIKVHRAIWKHPFFTEPFSRREAFIWLVSEAAWQGDRVGQVSHSQRHLAEVWGWTHKKVRCFLDSLEAHGMISRGTQRGTHKGTPPHLLTICNYAKYQTPDAAKGPEKGTDKGTIYKKKEVKKGNRIESTYRPTDETISCLEREGFALSAIEAELKCFIDYWIAQPGQKGVKLDWEATFRNWIRRSKQYAKPNAGTRSRAEERNQKFRDDVSLALSRARGQTGSLI